MTTLAVTLTLAVPAAQAEGSGAAGSLRSSAHSRAQGTDVAARVSVPERCLSSRKAVAYYRAYTHERQSARGGELADRTPLVRGKSCHWARYAARVWVARAKAALKALHAWEYEWAWWKWLPAKHQRVAACETGHQGGDGPGGSRWDWDSGTYVSAFGIYRQGYDDDAHRIGNLGWDETKRKLGRLPTPREQMQAVDSHRAAHGGWSGWGCRGA